MINDKPSVVYMLHNPETGQAYVGSTCEENKRLKRHLSELKNNKHKNNKLQNAYNKNPNFDVIIADVDSREAAFDFEQLLIDEFIDSGLLLNIARDARDAGKGMIPSEETRKKIGLAHLNNKHKLGYVTSEETKEKIRNANLGKKHTEEFKNKCRERMTGITFSEETLKNITNGNQGKNKGRIRSEEEKENLRQLNLGKKQTQETIDKRTSKTNGQKRSPEFCEAVRLRMIGNKNGLKKSSS